MYLNKINKPQDLKKLSVSQLNVLSDEIRKAIINRVSKIGGHLGSNLGIVELTVALHYVFSSPKDKFVFDTSHQSYPHKIITGRKKGFLEDNFFKTVTGFTNPNESQHDMFKLGHTSTSIALALGLAKARDLNHTKENIVAIIGDGSLSGGIALEALNNAGEYNKNLIIIVNDNDQSIVENHGGMYKCLKELRDSNGNTKNNLFKSMGLDYHYLENGNDIKQLIDFLNKFKNTNHPVLLHIHTIKGKGLKFAEQYKEKWHYTSPFNPKDGALTSGVELDPTIIYQSLADVLTKNKKTVVVNAATALTLGFNEQRRNKFVKSNQFIDTGIAEQCAVSIAAGIAKNNGRPIFATVSAFFQRAYDQISHDICLNNLPVVLLILNAGVYGMSSDTHIALNDFQMLSHIPNLVYLAPATVSEYTNALNYAVNQNNHPIGIRVPVVFSSSNQKDKTNFAKLNKNKVLIKGKKVAIFAIGNLIDLALEVANKLKQEKNLQISVINPLFLTGLDTKLLDNLKKDHQLIISLEDDELFGGYGQMLPSYYGKDKMKVMNFGISKYFHNNFKPKEILEKNGISLKNLYNTILQEL